MPEGTTLATARGLAEQFRRCYSLRLSLMLDRVPLGSDSAAELAASGWYYV